MVRILLRFLKFFGINALGRRAYAFYVQPLLSQMPYHTLQMLSDLEEFCAIRPLLCDKPGKGPILVFAPHQDDEIIGAGGSLVKHVVAGDYVRIAYITDGSSIVSLTRKGPEASDYVQRREQEATLVCKALGAAIPIYYSFPNRPRWILSNIEELIQRITQTLYSEKPRLVYVPFFLDKHPIHKLTNIALCHALRQHKGPSLLICGYSVWSLMPVNIAVDITYEMPKKLALLALYASQYPFSCDYMNCTEGMNRYQTRLVMRPERSGSGLGAVECFFRLPAEDYADLVLGHEAEIVASTGLEE